MSLVVRKDCARCQHPVWLWLILRLPLRFRGSALKEAPRQHYVERWSENMKPGKYYRLAEILVGLHYVAFAILWRPKHITRSRYEPVPSPW